MQAAAQKAAASALTAAILKKQDDICSTAVIELLKDNETFRKLAQSEGELIVRRDKEDEEKLEAGVQFSVKKGILAGKPNIPEPTKINVLELSAEQVAERILSHLPSREGNVIVLQGLSGTGKGTTVGKLQQKLPRCVTWSNGNVFRSYTYLCDQVLSAQGKSLSEDNLTADLIEAVAKRVTFEKVEDGSFQTLLDGKQRVVDIQNTLLKAPFISEKVPTVAQLTQGEVICFGAGAVKQLSSAGYNVILEGRAQTLNYIPTNLRFELVIPDVAMLGQRRAAQRVMAKALTLIPSIDTASDEEAQKAVQSAAAAL